MARNAGNDPITTSSAIQISVCDSTMELKTAVGRIHPRAPALDFHRAKEGVDAAADDSLNGP
jgi:hypothetical protein